MTSLQHDMSDDTVSDQFDTNQLLDLGLKCKGFRMGHMNIPEDQWSCKRSPETREIYQ